MNPISLIQPICVGVGVCAALHIAVALFNNKSATAMPDPIARFMFKMDAIVFCICACIVVIAELLS